MQSLSGFFSQLGGCGWRVDLALAALTEFPLVTRSPGEPQSANRSALPARARAIAQQVAVFPMLAAENSAWELACRLRDYVYRVTPWSLSASSQSLQAGERHWAQIYEGQISVWDHLQFMRCWQGGHFCGGTAAILTALAQACGLEAWFLNTGLPDTPSTHALTLIQIPMNGKLIYTLHDPTINCSYTKPNQQTPLDYFEIIELLQQGDVDDISRSPVITNAAPAAIAIAWQDDLQSRDPFDPEIYGWLIDRDHYQIVHTRSQEWRLMSPRTLENFESIYQATCGRSLVTAGHRTYANNSLYLNLLPFQILGTHPAVSQALLQRAWAGTRSVYH